MEDSPLFRSMRGRTSIHEATHSGPLERYGPVIPRVLAARLAFRRRRPEGRFRFASAEDLWRGLPGFAALHAARAGPIASRARPIASPSPALVARTLASPCPAEAIEAVSARVKTTTLVY
jgi:hypothetical protein